MSPVRVRVLVASRVRLTSPALSALMVLCREELLAKLMVRLEMESTTMLPVAFWLVRLRVTVPPLLPDLPQESFWTRRKLPVLSLLVI